MNRPMHQERVMRTLCNRGMGGGSKILEKILT